MSSNTTYAAFRNRLESFDTVLSETQTYQKMYPDPQSQVDSCGKNLTDNLPRKLEERSFIKVILR